MFLNIRQIFVEMISCHEGMMTIFEKEMTGY